MGQVSVSNKIKLQISQLVPRENLARIVLSPAPVVHWGLTAIPSMEPVIAWMAAEG